MRNERGLNLCGAEAMAGDIDHVIDATRYPVVPIGIATAAIAREVLAAIRLEVRIDEALVVSVHGSHLSRPGIQQAQVSTCRPFEHLAVCIHELRDDAEQRLRRGSGL